MKKKIFSIFLVMVLCIGMTAGCKKNVGTSQDNAIAEEDDDSKEEAKSYRFGFSCITMENPYYITLEQALREAVEAQGSTLVTKDPALNVDTQIEQIHQMIKDGLDAIFLCPVSRDAITPALEELKEADVKIINIDTEVKDTDYIDAFIGSDNKAAGQLCGEDLIQQSPDGGKIVILEGLTQNSIVERITGFEEAIAGKGFEIVGRADVSGDLNEAREAANKIFAENKDVTAVMCGNDQIALGALAFLIVLALHGLAVDLACRTRLTSHIAVGAAFSFFKAVTACLCSFPCRFSSHRNCVQITIKIFVVHTCLYCTF